MSGKNGRTTDVWKLGSVAKLGSNGREMAAHGKQ